MPQRIETDAAALEGGVVAERVRDVAVRRLMEGEAMMSGKTQTDRP